MTGPGIEVRPLTAHIGAEVSGLDLAGSPGPLEESVAAEIRQALLAHGVLFFRDQDLSSQQQLDFAAVFGPVNGADFARPEAAGADRFVDWVQDSLDSPPGADFWHTDLVVWPAPPNWAILNSRTIPPTGGDTLWLSLYALYDALSPTMQSVVDTLQVDVRPSVGRVVMDAAGRSRMVRQPDHEAAGVPSAIHPLVRVHPETGRKALYLMGATMYGLVGMSARESAVLLDLLREGLHDPGIQCRWHWQEHDLVIWDERCTNHRATSDHYPQPRLLRRCTAGTSVPYGVGALAGS